jgi:hypothetical protein
MLHRGIFRSPTGHSMTEANSSRIVAITGVSSGIGRATTLAFA